MLSRFHLFVRVSYTSFHSLFTLYSTKYRRNIIKWNSKGFHINFSHEYAMRKRESLLLSTRSPFCFIFRLIFKEQSLSRDGFSWKYGRSLTNELHFRFFNALMVINTATGSFTNMKKYRKFNRFVNLENISIRQEREREKEREREREREKQSARVFSSP